MPCILQSLGVYSPRSNNCSYCYPFTASTQSLWARGTLQSQRRLSLRPTANRSLRCPQWCLWGWIGACLRTTDLSCSYGSGTPGKGRKPLRRTHQLCTDRCSCIQEISQRRQWVHLGCPKMSFHRWSLSTSSCHRRMKSPPLQGFLYRPCWLLCSMSARS